MKPRDNGREVSRRRSGFSLKLPGRRPACELLGPEAGLTPLAVLMPLAGGLPPLAVQTSGGTVSGAASMFLAVLGVLFIFGLALLAMKRRENRRAARDIEALEALLRPAERLAHNDPAEHLYQDIVRDLPALVGATHCFIWGLEGGGQQLELLASSSSPATTRISFSAMSGAVSCFRKRSLLEVPDAAACPFINQDSARRLGQRALLYIPILVDDECAGVLEIEDRKHKRLFSPREKAAAQLTAQVCAASILAARQRDLRRQLLRWEKTSIVGELIAELRQNALYPLLRAQDKESNGTQPSQESNRWQNELAEVASYLEDLCSLTPGAVGRLERTDVNRLLRDLFEEGSQNADAKQTVRLDLAKEPALVMADQKQFRGILVRLIQQAQSWFAPDQAGVLEVGTRALDEAVLIWMNPDERPALSSREARKADASAPAQEADLGGGFGLCRSVLESAGASLSLDRSSPKGFSIEIRYPSAQKPAEEEALASGSPAESGREQTALIVHSDRSVRNSLLYPLSEWGLRVVPVSRVEVALDLCRRMDFQWAFCEAAPQETDRQPHYERIGRAVGKLVLLTDEVVQLGRNGSVNYERLSTGFTEEKLRRLMESDREPRAKAAQAGA